MRGVCNHCDTELTEVTTADDPRLQCPDCGYTAGLYAMVPGLDGEGEPGEDNLWPRQKHNWDIDDGRATVDYAMQGEHIGCGDFVENTKESRFGKPPMCCDGCGLQFSCGVKINTLVDPVNGINHLDTGD